ncbi:MAG: hypothetical protein ABTQ32_07425 [Myxococcaceae bacterium]
MRPALLTVLLAGCATRETGIEVAVEASVVNVTSGTARLTVTRLRGVPCLEVMARHLSPISTAWAHGSHAETTSPLRADVDLSLDLSATTSTPVATLRPPPGTWCALEVTFSASTSEDVWGGTTLFVETRGRRYLSNATRTMQLASPPHTLSAAQPRLDLRLAIDAAPLASIDPAAPDARLELLDTLMSSLSVSLSE